MPIAQRCDMVLTFDGVFHHFSAHPGRHSSAGLHGWTTVNLNLQSQVARGLISQVARLTDSQSCFQALQVSLGSKLVWTHSLAHRLIPRPTNDHGYNASRYNSLIPGPCRRSGLGMRLVSILANVTRLYHVLTSHGLKSSLIIKSAP